MASELNIPNRVLNWLLEPSNPSVRYRTLIELLDGSSNDSEIQQTYNEILNWKPVVKIKKAMHPDGYWEVKVDKGKIVGKGTEYRTFNTTHWVLGYLAEYGLTRKEKFIDLASNRYLNLQKKDGDFWQHLSCLYGLNLHTFSKLGFESDPRIQKTLDLVASSIRYDNGYLCDLHEGKKRKGRDVKSCFRGTLKILFGLSEYPSTWTHSKVKLLLDYFLNRELLFKKNKPYELVVKNAGLLVFPFTYRASLLESLYPLLKMGYGSHPKVIRAWKLFESKKLLNGRFPLEWNPPNKYLKPGNKGDVNKWVTFYAYLLYKLKNTENS
ncbi:hypothetical protein DSAG12_00982 [Promethearchaeum syntrophicum]|uniref:Prenyltransferase and squalene oxidase repeat protein n=1 Tax=Promethearchaeum syntrophicum TaxID=2594042 RepID=A0A5B9D7I7_9ARCH|nr:hypothetical protein [Candidatus Prometheoarchaeum syntrophicum]QEE15158.1 hypothetical protein DSAG12_00982 [Candidatus Prometheoarchaeum syntrophicum]